MAKLTREKLKGAVSAGSVMQAKDFFAQPKQRGNQTVAFGDVRLSLTNLHKVYWPKEGYTKFDVLKYYYTISKTILPYLKDRPLILKRYPNGITGPPFYQHNLEDAPDFIRTYDVRASDGQLVHYALADKDYHLVYLSNLGVIAQNPFHSRIEHISQPDYFVFDLDPGDKTTFDTVQRLALEVKEVLDDIGLVGYPKTSGSSGIHIYIPIAPSYTYDDVVRFSKKVATLVAERNPEDATVERMTRNRTKKQIYVDYLQNIEGKSIASAYSIREKKGATVSMPLEWKEIKKGVKLSDFTIENAWTRIQKKGDIFQPVLKKRQSLAAAEKKLAKLLG